jgi:putative transposase
MLYRGFPGKLYHRVPSWIENGSLFHIRIRLDRERDQLRLTDPSLAPLLLGSAKFYQAEDKWFITIFLIMPDHIHAMLSFPRDQSMSEVVRQWKSFHKRHSCVVWQDNFFDHRLRDDERGQQVIAKLDYIRNNPVAAGLCVKAEDWPWTIDPQGGSAAPSDDVRIERL